MATRSTGAPTFRQVSKLENEARQRRRGILESGLPLGEVGEPAGPGAQTKVRILDTAVTVFADRGFEAGTMRDLASAVGIKAPAIYNHYKSKDDVLAAAMEHILGRFFWEVLMPLEEIPTDQWLQVMVEKHVHFQLENPRLSQANDSLLHTPAVERVLPRKVFRRIVGAERDYVELIRALVRVSSRTTNPDESLVAAFSIIAMCDRVATWYDPDGRMGIAKVSVIAWKLASQMIHANGLAE